MNRSAFASVTVAGAALAVLLVSLAVLLVLAARTFGWSAPGRDDGLVPSGWPQTAPRPGPA